MNSVVLGLLCGFAFGIFDVLIMIPLPEKDTRKKREAMAGAFLERFMIGFLIPNVDLQVNNIITGLIVGIGLSVPTAIITRVYAPIIGIGILGGVIIGVVSNTLL